MANIVNALSFKNLEDVDDYMFPPHVISIIIWGKYDEALIYEWNGAIDKTLCFDFGILITMTDIEHNLIDNVRNTPRMFGELDTRDSIDLNGI